jgi:hypothetical protein
VLTDLCQLTEALEHVQRTRELVEQQLGAAEPVQDGADRASTHQQQLAAALRAVPKYCCAADLMYRATPELLQLILSLDSADISQLFKSTFHELVALLELTSRHQEPAPAAPAQQAKQSEAVVVPEDSSCGTSEQATSSDNSHDTNSGSEGDRTDTPLPEASVLQHPAACQADPAAAAAEEAAMLVAVERLLAVMVLNHLLQPLPMIKAACVNHLTNQQGEAPRQHWPVSTTPGF